MNRSRSKLLRHWRVGIPLLAVAFALGCDSDPADPVVPAALTAVSGTDQTILTGASSDPFIAGVWDHDGSPLDGVEVTWEISEGDGTLSASSTLTDAAGEAQVTLSAAETAGTVIVTATVPGLDPVLFTVTVTDPEQ